MKSLLLFTLLAGSALTQVAHADTDKIRIATQGAFPPFNYVSSDGALKGFDVDIARALCDEMKVKCELIANEWEGMIPGLQAKKFDAVISSMSVTDERKKKVSFTDKYYSTVLVIAVPSSSDLKEVTTESMKGRVIGVQASTLPSMYAEDTYGKNGADIRLYQTADEAHADLKNGRLDAVISDNVPIIEWMKLNGDQCCKILSEIAGTETNAAIAIRPDDNTLRDDFNLALKAIRKNGVYQKISSKYFDIDIYN